MTVHGTELIVILIAVGASMAGVYALTLARVKRMIAERQLNIADQLAKLDEAIRVMETRLAEHHTALSSPELYRAAREQDSERGSAETAGAEQGVAPEIKAAIAAAAVAVAGPHAQVSSVKPVSAPAASPWTQQGRVMVQAGHNLRVRQ